METHGRCGGLALWVKNSGEIFWVPVAILWVRQSPQGASMSDKTPNPNDQRSDTKNPNNPAHKVAQDNRANQLNPNHQPTKGK